MYYTSPECLLAEDVSITNITSDSADVSWTVLFISTEQDYVVEYGQDEDNLNEISETLSVSDTNLVDQMYSVTLSGLSQSIVYYVRVATTNDENVTFYSDIESFRTVEPGKERNLVNISYLAILCIIHILHAVPSGAPQNFTISVEKTTLTFEWDPPAEDERGGTLVSYTLACNNDDDGDDAFEVDLNVIEKITVDEFLPSTSYTCTILASTNGGDGPTASVSATTESNTIK